MHVAVAILVMFLMIIFVVATDCSLLATQFAGKWITSHALKMNFSQPSPFAPRNQILYMPSFNNMYGYIYHCFHSQRDIKLNYSVSLFIPTRRAMTLFSRVSLQVTVPKATDWQWIFLWTSQTKYKKLVT